MAVSSRLIIQTGVALVRNTFPLLVALIAFRLPVVLFGTPAQESPVWEMIKQRHFAEAQLADQYEIEHFGSIPRVARDLSVWDRGQRQVRMFVRGLSIDPGATVQDAIDDGMTILAQAAHELHDSEWGESVRNVAKSFRGAVQNG